MSDSNQTSAGRNESVASGAKAPPALPMEVVREIKSKMVRWSDAEDHGPLHDRPKGEATKVLAFAMRFLREQAREVSPVHNLRMMGKNVRGDILAGITVAIVALPLALAFGVGSGLGAITGLYGAICGGLVGGLFGGSSIGVSGPTGPKMVQLAAVMEHHRLADGSPDITFAFSIIFLSGVILLLIAATRLGRLVQYTPYSVVAGFMCGIGVLVIILEVDPLFGYDTPHSVVDALADLPQALLHPKPSSLVVSIPSLVIVFGWPFLQKRVSALSAIPGPIVALVVGTGLAVGLGLDVPKIGHVPTGLPELHVPDFSRFHEMVVPAAALAGLAVFDSLLTCLVNDQLTGERHSSDRECFGQGLANCAAGLVGGLTTATATMRSVTAFKSGGRTPLAAVTHGLVLLALTLGLGPLAEEIPLAVLAAILFKVGADILDYRVLPVLHRIPVGDAIVFWIVLVVTVWVDLLVAMGVGVAFAVLRFVQEMTAEYAPKLETVKPGGMMADSVPGVAVLRPRGPLFFGSVAPMFDAYAKAPPHAALVVDLSRVSLMDLSGAFAVQDLVEKAAGQGVEVFVTGLSKRNKRLFHRLRLHEKIGQERFVEDATPLLEAARNR